MAALGNSGSVKNSEVLEDSMDCLSCGEIRSVNSARSEITEVPY